MLFRSKLTSLAVQGPRAREILRDAGFVFRDVGPMEVQDIAWNDAGLSITRMASDVGRLANAFSGPPSGWLAGL